MMVKSMHVTSYGLPERDLPYITCFEGNLIGINIFAGDTWVLIAVELKNGTGGTKTWRSRLSPSRSSWEAGVHQLVSALDDEYLIIVCLMSRQQHKKTRTLR